MKLIISVLSLLVISLLVIVFWQGARVRAVERAHAHNIKGIRELAMIDALSDWREESSHRWFLGRVGGNTKRDFDDCFREYDLTARLKDSPIAELVRAYADAYNATTADQFKNKRGRDITDIYNAYIVAKYPQQP